MTTKQAKTERAAASQREASQAVMRQMLDIQAAIELLATTVESITSTINPESATWREVSEHAMTAELARKLVAEHIESEEA